MKHHMKRVSWKADEKKIELFGVSINRVSQAQAISQVQTWLTHSDANKPKLLFTPDTTALMRARWDEELRRAYQHADLVVPDGTGLLLASKLLNANLPERVAGIDLMEALCSSAAKNNQRVYFLGAKPGIAEKAATELQSRYRDLNVCGTHHGYFVQQSEAALIDEINEASPDVLFVGMGVPHQEKWIVKNRHKLNASLIMGVGGSFDVFAGAVERAPETWQKAGMEWAWRTIQEPWRLQRISVLPLFVLQVVFYRALSSIFVSA